MKEILNIFYNEIIPEAATGRVDCYLYFNIIFDTIIADKQITRIPDTPSRILVPTLIIKNTDEFNRLLIEYVQKAYEFYKESFFVSKLEIDDPSAKKDYLKSIMTLLWSNATSEDFVNPCEYLRKRIAFLNDTLPYKDFEAKSTSLGLLTLDIKPDQIYNETPYYMEFKFDNEYLPVVRYGIYNGKAYIYAIQNISKIPRSKSFNRALYKVNEGIDLKLEESNNILHPENLKGITPSTLLSAALAIAYLKQSGIDEIVIPVILPERWNAKEIIYQRKESHMKIMKHPQKK